MMNRPIVILCLVSCLVVISACVNVKAIYYDDDKAAARKKIEQIHQLYNQGDFAAVYDLVTDRLKKETAKDAFVASLTKLKEDMVGFLRRMKLIHKSFPTHLFAKCGSSIPLSTRRAGVMKDSLSLSMERMPSSTY